MIPLRFVIFQMAVRNRTNGGWEEFLQFVSWWPVMVAAVALILLIWAILHFVARANEGVDPAEADRQMLLAMNELRREGDLSESEFRSIKGQLVSRFNEGAKPQKTAGKSAKTAEWLPELLVSEITDLKQPEVTEPEQQTE
jgi:hypothetical protein